MTEHPSVLRHPNKRLVFDIACPADCNHSGVISYSRWRGMPLPEMIEPIVGHTHVESREGIYDYLPTAPGSDAVEWHVNFADANLFFGYGGPLFAQDEIQVAEHPALGALREALIANGIKPRVEEDGKPTPVLVAGVERRCRISTDKNADLGRPHGLYGNAFGSARANAVRRATHPIVPPTVSNILAMAAPGYGTGQYNRDTIRRILTTAYTGFRAAYLESKRLREKSVSVIVHSGFWGCGAFGGNRVLMLLAQIFAAHMAGLDALVLHVVNTAGSQSFTESVQRFRGLTGEASALPVADIIDRLEAMTFNWGTSDGN